MKPACQVTILTASDGTALTKTFRRNEKEGYIDVLPYPLVTHLTSTTISVSNAAELHAVILTTAQNNGCLLKGVLDRDLVNESRRGHNNPITETSYLVFDWDRGDGFATVDDLLATIDPALASVSYTYQRSASAGLDGKTGIRGKIFVLLRHPTIPQLAKEWIKKLNLTIPEFRDRIELSSTGTALKWALDPTVNQNDKLIYVAAPRCEGFDDPLPIESRITFVQREEDFYDFSPLIDVGRIRQLQADMLAALQQKYDKPVRQYKTKTIDGVEIATDIGPQLITGIKIDRDYIRLNLNGSTSWHYWTYRDNPKIVYSFADEPAFLLEQISAEHYREFRKQAQQAQVEEQLRPLANELVPFAFRDKAGDCYYNGFIDNASQRTVDITPVRARDRIDDFFAQYGQPAPEIIPDWRIEFAPDNPKFLDVNGRWINTFTPSRYMEQAEDPSVIHVPTQIQALLRHVLVDNEFYTRFLHWLAYVFQYRKRSQLAWLTHGTTGTGKGTIYHQIITPLFGREHCKVVRTADLLDDKNGFIKDALFVMIDEADFGKAGAAGRAAMTQLRTYITEPTIPLRAMRANVININNYSNWYGTSNEIDGLILNAEDRRWNVPPRQERSFPMGESEIEAIRAELPAFASYLQNLKVNIDFATRCRFSEAKQVMTELTRSAAEEFFAQIKLGNLDYFAEYLRAEPPSPVGMYFAYEKVIKDWIANAGQPYMLRFEDAQTVYQYMHGKEITPKGFGWLARKGNVDFNAHPRKRLPDGRLVRVLPVIFHATAVEIPEREADNVLPFEKSK